MNEILSWAHLGMLEVSIVVVTLTQILKDYIPKIDPKWIALVLSLVITISFQVVSGDLVYSDFLLSFINAIISAGAAIGAYEGIVKPFSKGEGGNA